MLLCFQKRLGIDFHLIHKTCRNTHTHTHVDATQHRLRPLVWSWVKVWNQTDQMCCGAKYRSHCSPVFLALTSSVKPPEHLELLLNTYLIKKQEGRNLWPDRDTHIQHHYQPHHHFSIPLYPATWLLSFLDSKNRPKSYHGGPIVALSIPLIGGR